MKLENATPSETLETPFLEPKTMKLQCGIVEKPHLKPIRRVFYIKGHKKDTMKYLFTKPQLSTNDPNKWFIWYNYRVPPELIKGTMRGWKRFRVYMGMNRAPVEDRMSIALELMEELTYCLKYGLIDPFAENVRIEKVIRETKKPVVRKEMLCREVLPIFIQSRRDRKLNKHTVDQYQDVCDWLLPHIGDIAVGKLKHTDISNAVTTTANEPSRNWIKTTINTNWGFVMPILNWMEIEDYLDKNPCKGKFQALKTEKSANKWYDKETAKKVKDAIRKSKYSPWLLNVCQFTYEILIRSQTELMQIKVGDIDMDLHCVNFRKEWTKNSRDQSRDYSDSFHEMALRMGLDKKPKEWYVFGKLGMPGPLPSGSSFFSKNWAKLRNKIGLGEEYTIYGWKHTAIVHDMMKGVDGYEISHRARHSDIRTTDDYKRDYDITLNRVYSAEDLKF